MKIILTGANGFLGSNIIKKLSDDHEIIKVGRSAANHIISDLSVDIPKLHDCDMVVHAAGKAHIIPKTQSEINDFFSVNVNGTKNLITAINKIKTKPNTFIFISSVAVYGLDFGSNISEDHPLNANTPYALSKKLAEELLIEWGIQNNINVVILRIPLLAGINPVGNLRYMIRAIQKGYYFRTGTGDARKSILHVDDLSRFLPSLYGKCGVYNLTDGYHPKVSEIENLLSQKIGKRFFSIPEILIRPISYLGDFLPFFPINSYRFKKLTQSLTFNDDKARRDLQWKSNPVIDIFEIHDI